MDDRVNKNSDGATNDNNLIALLKNNLPIITASVTALSFILNLIFRLSVFGYYRGIFEYFKIPKQYINISYDLTFNDIMISIIISSVIIFTNYYCFKWFIKNKNKFVKIIKSLFIIPCLVISNNIVAICFSYEDVFKKLHSHELQNI